jgi:hypothetical protein
MRIVECWLQDFVCDQLGNRVGHSHIEPQLAGAGSQADRVHQLPAGGENLVRVAHDELAGLGQDEVPSAALEQLVTKRLFQQLDLRADRGLGDVQGLRGFADTAFASDCPEIAKMMKIESIHGKIDSIGKSYRSDPIVVLDRAQARTIMRASGDGAR